MRKLTALLAIMLLAGCSTDRREDAPQEEIVNQESITIPSNNPPGGIYEWENASADPAPEPVDDEAHKSSGEVQYEYFEEEIPPGWDCAGPAYQCRGAEAEREREEAYWDWVEEENGYDSDDGYWFEDTNDTSCEGAGAYGDYSPEGYVDC